MSYIQYGYNSQEDSTEELRRNLVKSVGFTPSDLAANRNGQMSTSQMLKVLYGAIVPLLGQLIPLIGILLLAALCYVFAPYLASKIRILILVGKYFMMALGAIAFGLLAIIMKSIFASGRLLGAALDLMAGKVTRETAQVRTSRSDEIEDGIDQLLKRRTQSYNFVVGRRELPVSKEAYEELTDWSYGGWFTVYYTPRSNFLLAIEPATQADVDFARSSRAA